MKGFKDTTRTQSGHGAYDETPTRPASSRDVAAAKAIRMTPPSKPVSRPAPQARVTDAMIRGDNEDKAPGERGAKKFAVGGMVPPPSSGMPAQGKPITNGNVNDARVRPPMPVANQRPVIAPRPPATNRGGLPKAWVDNYAADSARRLGANPQMSERDLMNRKADAAHVVQQATRSVDYFPQLTANVAPVTKSTGTPPARPVITPASATKPAYKKGGSVNKHEAKESKSKERSEHKQEGGELMAGRAQSLRDMVGKPQGRAGYSKGGKPSRWS